MKRTWLYSLAGVCFLSAQVWAQQAPLHCGADEMQWELLNTHPEYLQNWTALYQQQEAWVQQYAANRGGDTIYKIPVVVHVVHFDGSENITDAQIKNGIQVLTRNYRKLNPDTVEIVPLFKPLATDMKIEFELARLDPEGNCTDGINRIRSTFTNTGTHNVKSLVHWPREKYLNIYIVKNPAGLAGHALMPFQADTIPEWDGIVIAGDYFGNTGTSNDLKSVVLSHEVGHFFDLFHIWGGNNVPGFYYLPVGDTGNCAYDDAVFDTPNTIGWSSCNLSGNTCDSVLDNVQNFMDYAYCARMFTHGQKARVHAALNSPIADRNQLWTPANLAATGLTGSLSLCKADFGSPKTTWCIGDSVVFTDMSVHNPVTWAWDFGDGNTSVLQNPKHVYTNPGVYTVSLSVSDGTNTLQEIKTGFVYVLANTADFYLPYSEGFEDADSLTDTRMVGFIENNEPWTVMQTFGATGTQCLGLHNQDDTLRYKYTLMSPVLDFTGTDEPRIDFKYAFARKDSANNDQMTVRVTKNCGNNWVLLNTQTTNLPTHSGYVNGNYIPEAADWRQISITNLPGSYRTNGVIFKIEFISGGGNNFFIDDINVYDLTTIGIEEEPDLFIRIFPNPATTYMECTGDFENAGFHFTDLQGKSLMNRNILPGEKIDLSSFSDGIYIASFTSKNKTVYKKVVIAK